METIIVHNQAELEVMQEFKNGSGLFRAPGCGQLFFSDPNKKDEKGNMDWRWLTDEQVEAVYSLENRKIIEKVTRSVNI